MSKDFWRKTPVVVIGAGSWGTVLAQLLAQNCSEVRLWMRSEERVREMNSTRLNKRYLPDMTLSPNIKAYYELDRAFKGEVGVVVWALPSRACREQAKIFSKYFKGNEILLHATKGVEEGTLKRMSEILEEEIPCPRVGVISGPNLAKEIARGEPAATVVASHYKEVAEAAHAVLESDRFRVYRSSDVIGVEWAGTLKNVLAIASGSLDALELGWNSRSMLMSRGLAEMVRFGLAMGAKTETFLGLAGMGDLLCTCSSSLSRNYRVGYGLAKGKKINEVLRDLGGVAEGVRTAESVWKFASEREIFMPITETVYQALWGKFTVKDALHTLMTLPHVDEPG